MNLNRIYKKFPWLSFIASLLFTVTTSFGATTTFGPNLLPSTNHNLFTNGVLISRITVVTTNLGTAGATLKFYDANTNATAFNLGAYTNVTQYTTNIVSSYTNPAGVAELVTNSFLFRTEGVVGAATQDFRLVYFSAIPTNGTWIYTPVNPLPTALGLTITNSVGVSSITLDYSAYK